MELVCLNPLEIAGERGELMGERRALTGVREALTGVRRALTGARGALMGERGNWRNKHSLKRHMKWHVTVMGDDCSQHSDVASGDQRVRSMGLMASCAGSEALSSPGLTEGPL